MDKINTAKSWFFRKMNASEEEEREGTQVTNVGSGTGSTAPGPTDLRSSVRRHRADSIHVSDTSLEDADRVPSAGPHGPLPGNGQGNYEGSLKCYLRTPPPRKTPGPASFTGKLYQTFKEE